MAYSASERARLVEECTSSGLSVKAWCRANGVASSTMYEWIGGPRARGGPRSFVEASLSAPAPGMVCRMGPAEPALPAGCDERDVLVATRPAAEVDRAALVCLLAGAPVAETLRR